AGGALADAAAALVIKPGHAGAVGRQCEGLEKSLAEGKVVQFLAAGDLPDVDAGDVAGGDELLAIGGEGHQGGWAAGPQARGADAEEGAVGQGVAVGVEPRLRRLSGDGGRG